MAPSSHQYDRNHQRADYNYAGGDNKFISGASLAILIVFFLLLRSSAGPFLSPKVSDTLNFCSWSPWLILWLKLQRSFVGRSKEIKVFLLLSLYMLPLHLDWIGINRDTYSSFFNTLQWNYSCIFILPHDIRFHCSVDIRTIYCQIIFLYNDPIWTS